VREKTINKAECKKLIPHTPNFVEEVIYCEDTQGVFTIKFILCFPEDWDFLKNRIYNALPNSIIIEALGQVAMIFFKTIGEQGLPATRSISSIKNHAPFFDFSKNIMGNFKISFNHESKTGKIGKIYKCQLVDNEQTFFSLKSSTFVILKN
jgi:hypothetical protein